MSPAGERAKPARWRYRSAVEVARDLTAVGPRTACGLRDWVAECAPAGEVCAHRDECAQRSTAVDASLTR